MTARRHPPAAAIPNGHWQVTMTRVRSFRPVRRLAGVLAALATTLLAAATAAPAAFALPEPPVGGGDGTLPPRCRP